MLSRSRLALLSRDLLLAPSSHLHHAASPPSWRLSSPLTASPPRVAPLSWSPRCHSTAAGRFLLANRFLSGWRRQQQQHNMPGIDRGSSNSVVSPTRRDSHSNLVPKGPFMIGVAGGTASGKTTVCRNIMDQLGQTEINNKQKQVVTLCQDSFYKELNADQIILANKGKFNFDHPDAFDDELLHSCLIDIREGRETKVPVYDFKNHSRKPGEFTKVSPCDVVLVEGILVFYFPSIREMFHMKLFVDTDADTRLARRVLRDIEERGRTLDQVLTQYTTLVKPAFEEFCIPTKKYADVIVPRGAENLVAIDLIVQHIRDIIWRKNGNKSSSPLTTSPLTRSRSNSDSRFR